MPVCGRTSLSQSATSRVVSRLKERFESWRREDLSDERMLIAYFDTMRLPVPAAAGHEELRRDYRTIIMASNQQTRPVSARTLSTQMGGVGTRSGSELRRSRWRAVELLRLPQKPMEVLANRQSNRTDQTEFRRQARTQGTFTNKDSALILLYGLLALGQVNMRRIHGRRDIPLVAKMN